MNVRNVNYVYVVAVEKDDGFVHQGDMPVSDWPMLATLLHTGNFGKELQIDGNHLLTDVEGVQLIKEELNRFRPVIIEHSKVEAGPLGYVEDYSDEKAWQELLDDAGRLVDGRTKGKNILRVFEHEDETCVMIAFMASLVKQPRRKL